MSDFFVLLCGFNSKWSNTILWVTGPDETYRLYSNSTNNSNNSNNNNNSNGNGSWDDGSTLEDGIAMIRSLEPENEKKNIIVVLQGVKQDVNSRNNKKHLDAYHLNMNSDDNNNDNDNDNSNSNDNKKKKKGNKKVKENCPFKDEQHVDSTYLQMYMKSDGEIKYEYVKYCFYFRFYCNDNVCLCLLCLNCIQLFLDCKCA